MIEEDWIWPTWSPADGTKLLLRRQLQSQSLVELLLVELSLAGGRPEIRRRSTGALYRAEWDLVDAIAGGRPLDEIDVDDLPSEMQPMSPAERAAYVRDKTEARRALEAEIGVLAAERRACIEAEPRTRGDDRGLDAAMRDGIRRAAAKKGFALGD